MKAILLDNNDIAEWDEFILSSPAGAFSNMSGWRNVYGLYGFKSFPIAAIDASGSIRGIMPLFLMKNILGKKFLISNPFLSYGGLCAADKTAENAMIEKAVEIATNNNVEYFETRQLSGMIDGLPSKKDFAAMFLSLKEGEEYIWKNVLKPKVRNQIRKAAKSGLTVAAGNEYFNDFYRVLAINHRDFGTPLHHENFFKKVLEQFRERAGIIVVRHGDRVIAGMLYIHCRNVFSDPWASSLRKYNVLCPNNLLYWEAIKFANRNGFEYFDFGRSTINCGTYNFKKQWGAEPVQMNYQYFLNKAQKIPQVNVHNNRYQFAINIWKKLPMLIAGTIGPKVIRYLPEL